MKKKLSVVIISCTPFKEDGSLDEAAFRKQLRRFVLPEIAVYVAGSGSSEAYSYTPEERDRVLAISVEELKGKVPLRAMGCEPHTYEEMKSYLKASERSGIDAAQIFSLDVGHGSKPTNAELDHYYRSMIESTSIPIYLSSHQASGYFLPLDLVEKLVDDYPSITGIAYGGTDITYFAELIARIGERIEVHCAGPANALSSLGLGGNGFMGGEGNFSPEMVAAVIAAFAKNDHEGVRKAFAKLMAFARAYNRYGGSAMRGLKPLMNAFGLPGGTLRPPRVAISDAELRDFVRIVEGLDVPGVPRRAPVA